MMSLRRRTVLLTAAAVALAVVLSAIACYLAVDSSMRSRLDHQLRAFAGTIASVVRARSASGRARSAFPLPAPLPRPGLESNADIAIFSAAGVVYRTSEDRTAFPLTARDLAVARGTARAYFRNTRVGRTDVRVYVAPAGRGVAVIAEQSQGELQTTLHQLAVILAAIALAGVALAMILGLLVARAVTAPVHTLRHAAEHVRSTGDLTRRIETTGHDDLGRLGESFNAMLAALEESQRAQRQLVADASHELRTPVASLRTNLEVLLRNPRLDDAERSLILEDLVEQSAELGALVTDLLESARDGDDNTDPEGLRLDELVSLEIERCRGRHPHVRFQAGLEPCVIVGRDTRLRRAVANLLDNAVKWSPLGAPIEVRLLDGALTVRDRGKGFSAEDLPHVFDRFYRSLAARSVPGSGLGLSIVRKVAGEHGGTASAMNAVGGGASVTIVLPTVGDGEDRRPPAPQLVTG